MAQWRRLAASGNAMDQALSRELGASHGRALRGVERRQLRSARRVRADAADADQPHREIPTDLPERELTRGWLKASNRALDPARSKPWKPWHKLTRQARQKVTPGKIEEYSIEIFSMANLFRKGHRICVEITSLDLSTGVLGATNVEYIPYHVCSSRTVVHRIYHDATHPSHLLLPVIPAG